MSNIEFSYTGSLSNSVDIVISLDSRIWAEISRQGDYNPRRRNPWRYWWTYNICSSTCIQVSCAEFKTWQQALDAGMVAVVREREFVRNVEAVRKKAS